jgi:cation diffusion facilitator family transporter
MPSAHPTATASAGHQHGPDDGHDHARDGHGHDHHGHSHGVVDPSIATSERGLWVTKVSGLVMLGVALLELGVYAASRSAALLADMIHNFGDAATVVPLWIAFALARRAPRAGFSFGYGRAEDLAGVAVVIALFVNALIAGYESLERLFHPEPVTHLWAVAATAIIGFLGNEGVAIMRIRVGKEINSAALVADGHHARVDGWTSLAVLAGALCVYFGFPIADPIIGLLITITIFAVVWSAAKTIFTRVLDGVEPTTILELQAAALGVDGVRDVTGVRARWVGHRLHAEANVIVAPELSVGEGHVIATAVQHRMLRHMPHVSDAVIHVCPDGSAGEEHHSVDAGCTDCR